MLKLHGYFLLTFTCTVATQIPYWDVSSVKTIVIRCTVDTDEGLQLLMLCCFSCTAADVDEVWLWPSQQSILQLIFSSNASTTSPYSLYIVKLHRRLEENFQKQIYNGENTSTLFVTLYLLHVTTVFNSDIYILSLNPTCTLTIYLKVGLNLALKLLTYKVIITEIQETYHSLISNKSQYLHT